MMYNEILSSNVVYLQDTSLDCYESYVKEFRKCVQEFDVEEEDDFMPSMDDAKELTEEEQKLLDEAKRNFSLVLSEYSYSLIQFWKYEECEKIIHEAFDMLGLDITIAGKMGRRKSIILCYTKASSMEGRQVE